MTAFLVRLKQAEFLCVVCGYGENADVVGADKETTHAFAPGTWVGARKAD